jgi:hypothetical protein
VDDVVQILLALAPLKDSVRPTVESGLRVMRDLFGESFKVAGGMLGDKMYAWQVQRRAKLAAGAKQIIDEEGIDPRPLATGFLVDYFEAAGRSEEDDQIDEMWARLLASAVKDDTGQHPSFVNVLRQLSGREARFLSEISGEWRKSRATLSALSESDPVEGRTVAVLVMLGILERVTKAIEPTVRGLGTGHIEIDPAEVRLFGFKLSGFGQHFLDAVMPPGSIDSSERQ